jgi:hypothetical protein
MPTLVGFGTFAALPEEQISEKISRRILSGDQGMVVWWSIGAGVHVEPHIPGGTEHEAWFREDTEVIDFFAPPREDFLLGGKPAYMSEG